MNILHIDSGIFGPDSTSKRLSARAVERLVGADPGAHVERRDLEEDPIPHLTSADFLQQGKAVDPVLEQFKAADIIVIGSPMYNFSISSQLKAWIDRIVVAGQTFNYSAQGPRGLAAGKRVIVVTARGGLFNSGSSLVLLDHQDPYLRALFGFLGIKDVTIIHAEGLAMSPDARAAAIAAAEAQIDRLISNQRLAA